VPLKLSGLRHINLDVYNNNNNNNNNNFEWQASERGRWPTRHPGPYLNPPLPVFVFIWLFIDYNTLLRVIVEKLYNYERCATATMSQWPFDTHNCAVCRREESTRLRRQAQCRKQCPALQCGWPAWCQRNRRRTKISIAAGCVRVKRNDDVCRKTGLTPSEMMLSVILAVVVIATGSAAEGEIKLCCLSLSLH